jgi:hypothetical protein
MLGLLAQTTYTNTEVSSDPTGILAMLAGLWILFLVVWVVSIIALWKVFEKAGIPGWKAIVPIYNGWLLFEMAGKPGWWALIGLAGVIPILGIFAGIASFVLYCIAALELGKAFGKSTAFSVVGLIIFNVVGLLMLGFDSSKYKKPATAPANFS